VKVKAYKASDKLTGENNTYFLVTDSWVKVVIFSQPPKNVLKRLKQLAATQGTESKLKNRFIYAVEPELIAEWEQ
jgi:hypothetical protein